MLTLQDVEIETASPSELTVVTSVPSTGTADTSMRVTGPRGREVTLHVRAVRCIPVLVAGRRRYRVTFAVLSQEPAGQ